MVLWIKSKGQSRNFSAWAKGIDQIITLTALYEIFGDIFWILICKNCVSEGKNNTILIAAQDLILLTVFMILLGAIEKTINTS